MSAKSVAPSAKKPQLVSLPVTHQQYVVEDGIMPKWEVHILAAASGAGKTTLMIQMIDDLKEGNKVFDAITNPVHPAYICNDRTLNDIKRTFDRIKPRNQYPFYSVISSPELAGTHTIGEIIRKVKSLHPEIDFIVFDPISQQVKNVNDAKEVSSLLRNLSRICEELKVTIMIIHHSAKVKTDAIYANPRQKMSGSAAWGGYSNLNLILEEDDESDPTNPIRKLHICPRNGANRFMKYILDENGLFTPHKESAMPSGEMAKKFNTLEDGLEFNLSEAYELFGSFSRGWMYRIFGNWIELGCLEKSGRGRYKKIKDLPQ